MGVAACGRVETYADDIVHLREQAQDLADAIADFTGVGQAVDWLAARDLERCAVDMVAMDEFEYDFLVETEPGGRWLAFGVT